MAYWVAVAEDPRSKFLRPCAIIVAPDRHGALEQLRRLVREGDLTFVPRGAAMSVSAASPLLVNFYRTALQQSSTQVRGSLDYDSSQARREVFERLWAGDFDSREFEVQLPLSEPASLIDLKGGSD
jgi:hypothetical protein